jgi:hypothetical protein
MTARDSLTGMTVPSGKYKGLSLHDLDDTTVQLLWASWNGIKPLKRSVFFKTLTEENQRRRQRGNQAECDDVGRIKNLALNLRHDELKDVAAWIGDLLRKPEHAEMAASALSPANTTQKPHTSAKATHKRSEGDWQNTHFQWQRGDQVEWVPHDVDMSERESEACPF